jgi:hypothetical protein
MAQQLSIAQRRDGTLPPDWTTTIMRDTRYIADTEVQMWCFKALGFILGYGRGTLSQLQHESACAAIAKALLRSTSVGLAQAALEAVMTLLQADGMYSSLLRAGTCRAVVSALNRHFKDRTVAKVACNAVAALHKGDRQNRMATTAGACDAAVSALKAHTGDYHVEQAACSAIIALGDAEANIAIP